MNELKDELIFKFRIKDYFQLVYQSCGNKIKKNLSLTLKLFLKHTTIKACNLNLDNIGFKVKNKGVDIDCIRFKKTAFYNQIYEVTTINPSSFLSNYFRK
jgi:hypothetical protein